MKSVNVFGHLITYVIKKMQSETQTFIKYKQSYALFVYRFLDLARMAPSENLKNVISKQVQFLYELQCLLIYNKSYAEQVTILIQWASHLGADIKLETFQNMYLSKLEQLDLQKLSPAHYTFTFTVIWDSIHLMCLVSDNIISNRQSFSLDNVMLYMSNIKWVFYNMFLILFCPICAKHYLTVNIFAYEFEKIETALYREIMGESIIESEEILKTQSHKNVIMKNGLLYASMVFHNHVNNYRPIQHKNKNLNNYQRMSWTILKSLLAI
uniref:p33 n=1 Tax=Adoxophyes orana granulovirus TaxID=170617 RepID=A0A0A7UYA2_GVAO|nr:P33 [Adoxophyes orana granulovirus]